MNEKERALLQGGDVIKRDMIAVILKLPDGSGTVERRVNMFSIQQNTSLDEVKDAIDALFPLVDNPQRAWDHPQDPITYTGTIKPGKEEEVAKLLDALPS